MRYRKEYEAAAQELEDRLRGTTAPENRFRAVLSGLFLKYAADNLLGAKSMEDMRVYAKTQKMLAVGDLDQGPELFEKVMGIVGRTIEETDVLQDRVFLDWIGRVFFRRGEGCEYALRYLAGIDLEERDGEQAGKNLIEALYGKMLSGYVRNGRDERICTDEGIYRIAREILNIRDGDTFVDFMAGSGTSTVLITEGTNPEVRCADLNADLVREQIMACIMRGYPDFTIYAGDCLQKGIRGLHGNRMYLEPTLWQRIELPDSGGYTDSQIAAVDAAMKWYLEQDGKAVILMDSATLASERQRAEDFRKRLVRDGFLETVIALPKTRSINTVLGMNLMVFSKEEKKRDDILFIDASEEKDAGRRDFRSLPQDLVSRILDTARNRKEEPGFSCVVRREDLEKDSVPLAPQAYVEKRPESSGMTVRDIDEQLAYLYEQLDL